MSTEASASQGLPPVERDFYSESFRGQFMVIGVVDDDPDVGADCRRVVGVLTDMGVRVLTVEPDSAASPMNRTDALLEAWRSLRRSAPATVASRDVVDDAAALATGMRADKLVLVGDDMPVADRGVRRSIADVLCVDLPVRLGAVVATLNSGVSSVNLVPSGELERELFTYSGAGTMLTVGDYGETRRLGFADYELAAAMWRRGAELGDLLDRSAGEIDLLLPHGLGWFPSGDVPAGVAAVDVDRYVDEGFAELEALFTISRFQNEGVGKRLVAAALSQASDARLMGIFAVTTSRSAGAFFEAQGFVAVDHAVIPARRWIGYPSERRSVVRCFLQEI